MMRDIAVLAMAAGFWVGFAYKLRHLRQRSSGPGGPALGALVVLLGTLAWSIMLGAPVVSRLVDPVVGLPGITRLVANVVSMATCVALREWMLHLSRPGDATARIAVHRRRLVPAVVLVLVLYVLDHPPVTAEREFAGLYTYVFLLYVLGTASPVAIMFWEYARKVDSPMMRLGLRMAGMGMCISLAGLATGIANMLEVDLTVDLPGSPTITKLVYSTGSVLFVSGLVLPAVGPRIGLEALWWRGARWWAARRLRRLWCAVTTACPGVVLDRALLAASPYGDRLLAERLPVEIYDGWLELRHYLRANDVTLVDRFVPPGRSRHRPARLAAAYLALAMKRKFDGAGQVVGAPVIRHFPVPESPTLLGDVRFLCDVSRQLQSRAVRQLVSANAGSVVLRET